MPDILILHGWALIVNPAWNKIAKRLKQKGYNVYMPKIPGLTGNALKDIWDMQSYTDWLSSYIKNNNLKDFVLVGHSFGGSVAIKYAAGYSFGLKGLVLIDSSGIRRKSIKNKLISAVAKSFKILFVIFPLCIVRDGARILFYKLIGSKDYIKTRGYLTKTFSLIMAEDLSPLLAKIKCQTLLLWGRKDKDTPLEDARQMRQEIKNSRLLVFNKASHGLPFQEDIKVAEQIDIFAKSL